MDEQLSDHIWILFQNLKDEPSEELIQACMYFVDEFDFDSSELPPNIEKSVLENINIQKEQNHYDHKVSLRDDPNHIHYMNRIF